MYGIDRIDTSLVGGSGGEKASGLETGVQCIWIVQAG